MNSRKAMRRAAFRSLDGHCRFVAISGTAVLILKIGDLPYCPNADIRAAFSAGKLVKPR